MSATSSALQLGDLALTWNEAAGAADLSLIDSDLASDLAIETAVLLSLELDRRCEDDDVPPSGVATDRRGWWADEFAVVEGDRIGSRLWLLDRSARTNEVVLRAEQYAREALQWMIDDRVASSIDFTIDPKPADRMFIFIRVNRPGKDPLSLRYAHVWTALAAAL